MATVQQQQSLFSFWESPCVYWRRWHSLHCIGLSKNAQLLIASFTIYQTIIIVIIYPRMGTHVV